MPASATTLHQPEEVECCACVLKGSQHDSQLPGSQQLIHQACDMQRLPPAAVKCNKGQAAPCRATSTERMLMSGDWGVSQV